MLGDFGNHRGRREAMETIQRRDDRARREAEEASAIRERLEKQSIPGARANRAALLMTMGVIDRMAERPPETTLGSLRKMAQLPSGPADYAARGTMPPDHRPGPDVMSVEQMQAAVRKAAASRYF